jgi:drug/metabolite transporter (DMT)-like permease
MGFFGPICAFGASITWAIGSSGYSRISRGHSPFAVNFARASVALPLFTLAIVIQARGSPVLAFTHLTSFTSSQFGWLALSIFASYGLGDVFFMWSTRSIGVPAALAIGSTYPLFTAGVGALIQGEALAKQQILGLILSVAGVVTVILAGAQPTPASSEGAHAAPSHLTQKSVGVGLAFATMLMWSLNTVATSRLGKDVDPFLGNTIRMTFALAMSFTFSRVVAPKTEITLPFKLLKKSLPLFVMEAFGGSLLFIYGLSHSPLALGSTLASLSPVLSVPVALALKLEKFSVVRTLGVFLVVLGVWFLLEVF